jgi:DNA-binding beta-propeller fold protein YncE
MRQNRIMMKTCHKLTALLMLSVTIAAHADIPDGLSGTLIILNKGGDDASFVDLASGETVATLPTGKGPHELVISSDGQWAIGTDYGGGNSLTVFDVRNLSVQQTINLDHHPRPHGILLMPGQNELIVTSEENRTVALVDFVSGETRHIISTGQSGSHMVAVSEDGSTAFTANGGSDSVSVIDLRQKKFVKALDVPSRPEAITTNKAGDQVWVGSNNTGVVSVISVADGSIQAQWDEFSWPYRILLTSDENFALVSDMRKGELRIFDARSKAELGSIELPKTAPQGMALYSDDRTLFLSLSAQNRVVVIDILSRQVVGEYPAGSSPDGIGFSDIVVKP